MREPDFCICEKKGADQLCSNCKLQNFKLLACFYDFTGPFVLDLVETHENWFACVAAHISFD